MLGILVNIVLLILWISLLYFFKRNLIIVLFGLLVGISVFVLSGLIQFYWHLTQIPVTEWQSKVIIALIVEESSKFLFILMAAWIKRTVLSEVRIFGAAVGLGFAFIENFGFIANVLNLLSRGFTSWTMHISTT